MGSEVILIADLERGAIGKVAAASEEEYYVGLAGSPEAAAAAAAAAACSEGGRRNREVRRALRIASTVFVTIACLVVTLYWAGPTVKSFNGLRLSSTNLKLQDDVTAFEQPHRTSFHYQPAKNWMNDPNAPMYYKGYYHLFYQYNPMAAVWGNIIWGHAVSTDMVHWLYLEDALERDQWYDRVGVWSGSATIGPDGVPFILYTGGSGLKENTGEQLQNMAVPADPTDPLLRKWIKVQQNPIATHPANVGREDFRDPSTAWQQSDGSWVFTVGAVVEDRTGVALQYRSTDLQHWELEEELLHKLQGTGMWECVDFFPVDYDNNTVVSDHAITSAEKTTKSIEQKYVFKTSLIENGHDYYVIGTYDKDARKFVPDHPELDIGSGFRYDYGKFYASKTQYDPVKNRHVVWAWICESDSQAMDIAKGWSSVLGIPRTLALDSKTGINLIQWPIEEVNALRMGQVSKTDVKLDAGAVVQVEGAVGGQLDVEVVFEYPNISAMGVIDEANFDDQFDCSLGGAAHQGVFGPFGLLVLTDDDFQEQTAVFFYIAHKSNGQWTTKFCSDHSRSSLLHDVDKTVYGSDVTVLPTEDFLSLRVIVDRSIVESFVQGGRMAITSRVYPTVAVDDLASLYLFNNGTTPITVRSLDAYQMTHVVMHPI